MGRILCRAAMALLLASVVAPAAEGQTPPATELGVVVAVVDGTTLDVVVVDRGDAHVRLMGITVSPCHAADATALLRGLVEGRQVTLTSDPSQPPEDSEGRRPAYVDVGPVDAGEALIRAGWADVAAPAGRPFARLEAYRTAAADRGGAAEPCPAEKPRRQRPDAVAQAVATVRSYYHRLTTGRYRRAWSMLSSAVRAKLGAFGSWRAGYARSLGTRVNLATGRRQGSRVAVRVAIRSRDRDACSGRTIKQFFRGRWTVVRSGGSWRLSAVSMRKVGGGEVRLSRSQCARPNRPSAPSDGGGGGDRDGAGGGAGGSGDAGCHPSYTPCLPVVSDLDCSDVGGPVTVHGSDPYRLDADGDGVGCDT